LPFLIALGWAEQRMQIELNVTGVGRADIVCFRHPVRCGNEQCVLIIETKGIEQGLYYAADQAFGYAKAFPSCEVVLVTNGYCYKAYQRDATGNAFSTDPSAYLNITDPRVRYPLDPDRVGGALEVLSLLIPR
jgi:hypothetical protein